MAILNRYDRCCHPTAIRFHHRCIETERRGARGSFEDRCPVASDLHHSRDRSRHSRFRRGARTRSRYTRQRAQLCRMGRLGAPAEVNVRRNQAWIGQKDGPDRHLRPADRWRLGRDPVGGLRRGAELDCAGLREAVPGVKDIGSPDPQIPRRRPLRSAR